MSYERENGTQKAKIIIRRNWTPAFAGVTIFISCKIIITTLLFQFLGLMKREMITAQVMMEAYRHKTSMIMSSISFKDYFEQSPKSEELILSEMIKALAHNPTDDLKQMQKVKEDMPIDKAFGVIDKIVSVKDKIDKSFGKKPNAPNNEGKPPQE